MVGFKNLLRTFRATISLVRMLIHIAQEVFWKIIGTRYNVSLVNITRLPQKKSTDEFLVINQ